MIALTHNRRSQEENEIISNQSLRYEMPVCPIE